MLRAVIVPFPATVIIGFYCMGLHHDTHGNTLPDPER